MTLRTLTPGEWHRHNADGPAGEKLAVDVESYVVTAAWMRATTLWVGRVGAYVRAVDACLAAMPGEVAP